MNTNDRTCEAIHSLRPRAEFTVRDGVVEWHDKVQSEPTQTEIDAAVADAEAEEVASEYKKKRMNEYPPIGDQLDALWKQLDLLCVSGKINLIQEANDILGEVLAVKRKYPK